MAPCDVCHLPAGKKLPAPPGATSFDHFQWTDQAGDRLASRVPPHKAAVVHHKRNSVTPAARDVDDTVFCDSHAIDRPTVRVHQPAGGVSSITFGESMPNEEAEALLKRRPGSESKKREMSGNQIFEGPYPVRGDCGGPGSDKTGRCPLRPCSSAKTKELLGHNVFEAFTSPCHSPPPPRRPYEPEEMKIPPGELHRTLKSITSQIKLGGEVCIPPRRPKTAAAWAKQKELYGGMDADGDSAAKPVVSHAKSKELAGSNLFGTPVPGTPKEQPDPGKCEVGYCGMLNDPVPAARTVRRTKMEELAGHDVFNEDESAAAKVLPGSGYHQLSKAKAREMKGNNIFADHKPNKGRCGLGNKRPPGDKSSISLL